MSDRSVAEMADEVRALDAAYKSLGCPLEYPFMMVSFLSLGVIPALRLTNRGLVDGRDFTLVDAVNLTGLLVGSRHGHRSAGRGRSRSTRRSSTCSRSRQTSTAPSGSIRSRTSRCMSATASTTRHRRHRSDAKVAAIHSRLRYLSAPDAHHLDQERGDVTAVRGWWRLEDLGSGRTRATYGLEVDPGRMLGLLLRGPAEGKVRDFLLDGTAEGLDGAEAR